MLALALLALHAGAQESAAPPAFEQRSIRALRAALDEGRTTSQQLVQDYLERIERLDRRGPTLHAVLAINPDALLQARELDRELKHRGARGPLHGIPILLKDNIESADPLPTTAGSLALANNRTNRDAPIVANLRAAGAVILGKTNLSEWANFRSTSSISGWSAVGGLARNPHVLDRSACGSSSGSGTATAAGFAAAAVGTETDGSITCPAAMNSLVGLKPTVGLLSGEHIVPISHSQDTAGPMTISVADAAILLDAMIGGPRCEQVGPGCRKVGYEAALSAAALQGKRIGVLRFPVDRNSALNPVYERALQVLREAGATLIEARLPDSAAVDSAEEIVLLTEFKADLNAYLAGTPSTVTARTLAALIEFNRAEPRELSYFGQELFILAEATRGLDDPGYRKALADGKRLAGPEGILRVLEEHKLDLLVAPTNGPSWRIDTLNGDRFTGSFSTFAAVAGYPHLTVPMGEVRSLPVGISFIGPPRSEALLLGAGFAFESKARARVVPQLKPSIDQ